jgi:hypothetical protein
MEVHHAQHAGHKKKWHEYLLEFLMLFLAVFLGFIAENVREHKVEKARAKEFSKSLVQDLENDITDINRQVKMTRSYLSVADSILELGKRRLEGRNAAAFSFYARFVYWTGPVNWHRATFEQIKNSGSLRYFKNRLLSRLMEYDAAINDIQSEFDNHMTRGNMLLNPINKIIEPGLHHELSSYFIWTLDSLSPATRERFFSRETPSLENKRNEIRELLNMVVVQQRNLRQNSQDRLPNAIKIAKDLIEDLNKEYHFKSK